MQPHEERVIAEKNDLDDKIVKLKTFMFRNATFDALSDEERYLLKHQFDIMLEYSTILWQRIMLFSK